jgi:PilZ domain
MPPEGIRRSGRVPKEIAILLLGSDTEGKGFAEETKTLVLSRHGATLLSRNKLVPEQEMFISDIGTNKEVEVRLVGQIGERADGYIYGVAFLDQNINFWDIEFPPATQPEENRAKVLLECSGCQIREPADLDALEQDVYAVNEGILRYCKHCLLQTIWKQVRGEPESKPPDTKSIAPPPVPEPQPEAPPPPPAPPKNRRREVRARVNLKACIRFSGSEEVVVCEDLSRGGLCFKSRKHYPEKSMIEVAAPYSPGSQSIFALAEIMHVQELPKEKRFRCGAAYIKSPKGPNEF